MNETAITTAKLATPSMYGGSIIAILNGLDANTIQSIGLFFNIIGVIGGLLIAWAGYAVNKRSKSEDKLRKDELHQLEVEAYRTRIQGL